PPRGRGARVRARRLGERCGEAARLRRHGPPRRDRRPLRRLPLAPARRTLLEEGAEALLALLARAPLGGPAGGLGPVRPLAHAPLRPAGPLRSRPQELADRGLDGG